MSVRALSVAALAALLVLLAAPSPAEGSIFAVDLGHAFMKVALVTPGRTPVSIVTNEMSRRKTPSLVGFVDGARLVGEHAAGAAGRAPRAVLGHLLDLLGADGEIVNATAAFPPVARRALYGDLLRASPRSDGSPPGLALDLAFDERPAQSVEELVASLLHAARLQAAAAAEDPLLREAVLLAPPSLGPRARGALLDAAEMAGLHVLGLVHSHAAAALKLGLDRPLAGEGVVDKVILYDLGAGEAWAALVAFTSYAGRGGARTGQFETLDVAWESVGVADLENALVDEMAEAFAAQHPGMGDPRAHPRALSKLRAQAVRTVQVLSANAETVFSVEELLEGVDFRTPVTRAELEAAAPGWARRAAQPLRDLLQRSGVAPDALAAVELLGGGSRIPCVKAELQEALGGRGLDAHMDADEAAVFGAALFAANLSSQFRLRAFGMLDKTPFGLRFGLHQELDLDQRDLEKEEAASADRARAPLQLELPSLATERVLVAPLKRLGARRAITLEASASASARPRRDALVGVELAWEAQGGRPATLGRWAVGGLDAVLEKHANVSKVAFHTRVDADGLVFVDGADATVHELVPEEKEEEKKESGKSKEKGLKKERGPKTEETAKEGGKDSTQDSPKDASKDASRDASENASESAPEADANQTTSDPPRLVERSFRVPLKVWGGLLTPRLSRADVEAGLQTLARLQLEDEKRQALEKAHNALEAFVLEMRAELAEPSEALAAVCAAGDREAYAAELEAAEDWLADQEGAETSAIQKKLEQVRARGVRWRRLARERSSRPEALDQGRTLVAQSRADAARWMESKPWLEAEQLRELEGLGAELETWLTEVEKKQAALGDADEPAFFSEDVADRSERLSKLLARLEATPKPRPRSKLQKEERAGKGKRKTEDEKLMEKLMRDKFNVGDTEGMSLDDIVKKTNAQWAADREADIGLFSDALPKAEEGAAKEGEQKEEEPAAGEEAVEGEEEVRDEL